MVSQLQRFTTSQRALQSLLDHKALQPKGHFDYGDGRHGTVWIEPRQIIRHPHRLFELAQDFLETLPAAAPIQKVQTVIGPEPGGSLFAFFAASQLDGGRPLNEGIIEYSPIHVAISSLHGPKDEDRDIEVHVDHFYSHNVIRGRKIAVLDDVRNTGRMLHHVVGLIESAGGEVLFTGSIYDRMNVLPQYRLAVPHFALAEYKDEDQPVLAKDCAQCRLGVPLEYPLHDRLAA